MSLPEGEALIERIAALVHSFDTEHLASRAIALSRTAIIDTLGVALAGSVEPCTTLLLRTPGIAQASGPCTLFGTSQKTSALDAALVNGTASHALDYDDFSQPMGGHQSAPLVAPLIAVAEERGLSGAQVIHSYVVGVETEIRLARAVNFHHYDIGWHPTATLGVFGAAAACVTPSNCSANSRWVARRRSAKSKPISRLLAGFGSLSRPGTVGSCGMRLPTELLHVRTPSRIAAWVVLMAARTWSCAAMLMLFTSVAMTVTFRSVDLFAKHI